jgi:hypothetical protein
MLRMYDVFLEHIIISINQHVLIMDF